MFRNTLTVLVFSTYHEGMESTSDHQNQMWRVTSTLPTVARYAAIQNSEAGTLEGPVHCSVVVNVENVPGVKRMTLEVELVERRYNITNISVDAPPGESIDLALFKTMNFGAYLRAGIAHLIRFEDADGNVFSADQPMESPDKLMPVALEYSVAYALRQPPTKAVADKFGLSATAAAGRVKRARAKGLLPETTVGKAS